MVAMFGILDDNGLGAPRRLGGIPPPTYATGGAAEIRQDAWNEMYRNTRFSIPAGARVTAAFIDDALQEAEPRHNQVNVR